MNEAPAYPSDEQALLIWVELIGNTGSVVPTSRLLSEGKR